MNNYENCRRLRRYGKAKPAYEALMKFYPFTLEDLPGERWVPFGDYYQVSNFGRVKSSYKGKTRILKPALNSTGYLFVTLIKDSKKKLFPIHRLVARLFIPNLDNKPEINHLHGKTNNFAECLI